MEDIAPKLFENIKKEFESRFSGSSKIKELYKRIKSGNATYKDAHEFAIETGEILSFAFKKNIWSSELPDGRMYYNIADRIIRPMLKNNYELITEVSAIVQETMNKAENIGIKAIKPEFNTDRAQGIIDIVSGKEKFDNIAYMLDEPITNFSQSIVDDSIRTNADFQYRAGLSPKIIRTSTGKCCEWCDKLAGVYDYADVSNTGNDVFKRHKYCRCIVEYDIGDGKVQNVHSKKRSNKNDIEERIQNAQRYIEDIRKDEAQKKVTTKKVEVQKKDITKKDEAQKKDTGENKNILSEKTANEYIGKAKVLKSSNLNSMSLPELREIAEKTAIEFYKSGISGISFGNVSVERAAKLLISQGSRTSLKKDILSMRKALRDAKESAKMKLPRYDEVVIPKEKLTQYALNPNKDPDKAKAFEKALGYTIDDADDLINQINKNLPNYQAVRKGDRGWGETYEVVMELEGKNGKTAKVLTAWIDDKNNGEMRLTTVHVDD